MPKAIVICNQLAVLCFQHKRLHEDKETKDKERNLQKRVTDLSSTVTRLEKRVALLSNENETLVSIKHTLNIKYGKIKRQVKGIGTKTSFNGGFAFVWLSTKLCARLQRPDLFMNRPAINFLMLRRAS